MERTNIDPTAEKIDLASRLNFLHKAVDDTQATIRFIDTKAAFFVTLLSGMLAASRQLGSAGAHDGYHRPSQTAFLIAVVLTLGLCLRVIFPVIKPHNAPAAHPGHNVPKFFIHKNSQHRPVHHLFSQSAKDVLVDDETTYVNAILGATDIDLVYSMCGTLLTVSLIRQIKSDRLHLAMYMLVLSIALFIADMLT